MLVSAGGLLLHRRGGCCGDAGLEEEEARTATAGRRGMVEEHLVRGKRRLWAGKSAPKNARLSVLCVWVWVCGGGLKGERRLLLVSEEQNGRRS